MAVKILTVGRKSHHPMKTIFILLLPTCPGHGHEGQLKSCVVYSIIRHEAKIARRFTKIVGKVSSPVDVEEIFL